MGFVENINYVSSLDGGYGRKLKLSKSNLVLGTLNYVITSTMIVYNADQMIDELELTYSDTVNTDGLVSYVNGLITELETLGYTATGSVVGTTQKSIVITIESTDSLLVELKMTVANGSFTKYTIVSEISTPLKVLPYLADKGPEFANSIQSIGENLEGVLEVKDGLSGITTVLPELGNIDTVVVNIENIQKAALTTELTVDAISVPSNSTIGVEYDTETNTMEFAIPEAAVGKDGKSPQYEMVYDDDTGEVELVLTGYINNAEAVMLKDID